MESMGHKTFYYPLIYKRKFDVVSMVSGNAMAHVYVKNNGSWQRRTYHEDIPKAAGHLMDELLERKEVDIIMTRSDDEDIVVTSKRGVARIKETKDGIKYKVNGSDPFGYPKSIFQETTTNLDSLKATMDTDYPDALVQILQLFHSSRCGDIVVSATPGYDLRLKFEHPEHKASHGSLYKEHIVVPLISNTKLEKRPTRTVDVYPTILRLMGWSYPHRVDGLPLV
jgi:arylsulfatase A-like enzyme